METAQFTDIAIALTFLMAGKARFTVVSKGSGTRFTYCINKGKRPGMPHFVSVLTGPSNTEDYCFLGTIFSDGTYRHGSRSTIQPTAPSAKAFQWLWGMLSYRTLPTNVEIYHENRCGRCGRPLTVPSSLIAGLGPECATKEA